MGTVKGEHHPLGFVWVCNDSIENFLLSYLDDLDRDPLYGYKECKYLINELYKMSGNVGA